MKKVNVLIATGAVIFAIISCEPTTCTPSKDPVTIEKIYVEKSLRIVTDSNNSTTTTLNSITPDVNVNNRPMFMSYAWTHNSSPSIVRTFMKMDLSEIPRGAKITSAKLSLFQYYRSNEESFLLRSDVNDTYIARISSNWDTTSVTWNKQPSYSVNKLFVKGTTSYSTEYLDLDVTNLIADESGAMLPNYGLAIMPIYESPYRILSFGSSHCPDLNKRPILEINYLIEK